MTEENRIAYVGIDVAKCGHVVAIAENGPPSEVRPLGSIASTPDAVRRLVEKLAERYQRLEFCYEAGPTGYGLYRQRERSASIKMRMSLGGNVGTA